MENISIKTNLEIANLFMILAEGEKDIELSRQLLCENIDFDPYFTFKFLDNNNKNRITSDDIEFFLQKNGIFISKEEAEYIIMFYDEDFKGELTYMEFTNLVKSSTKLLNFTITQYNPSNISFNVAFSLKNILEKELSLVRRIKSKITTLSSMHDFNIHNIFNNIKTWTAITFECINNFLISINIPHTNSDVRNIITRLDYNRDGKVDLKEFHYFFGFKSQYNYLNNINTNKNIYNSDYSIDERKFLDYIKHIADIELKIENMKIDLALRYDFNMETCYGLFDIEHKGFISPSDLKEGLFKMEVYASDIDVNILMEKYDVLSKGNLSYGDLFDMIVPYENEYRKMVKERKNKNEPFNYSTLIYLTLLLKAIIEEEMQINIMKKGFDGIRKSLKDIFALIDDKNKGEIDRNDWENYLTKRKICLKDNKGRSLAFRRFDRKKIGLFDYCNLKDELTPI